MSLRQTCTLLLLTLVALAVGGCVSQTQVDYGYGMEFTEKASSQ